MNIVVLSLLLLLVFSCCFALHMLPQQNKTKWPQTRACTFDFLGTHRKYRNKLKRFVRSTGWPWSAVCHRLPDYRKSSTWGRLVILLMMHLNLRHERCESDWYNVQRHDSSCDPLSLHVQVSLKPSIQSWCFHRHLFMISTTVRRWPQAPNRLIQRIAPAPWLTLSPSSSKQWTVWELNEFFRNQGTHDTVFHQNPKKKIALER